SGHSGVAQKETTRASTAARSIGKPTCNGTRQFDGFSTTTWEPSRFASPRLSKCYHAATFRPRKGRGQRNDHITTNARWLWQPGVYYSSQFRKSGAAERYCDVSTAGVYRSADV